MHVTTDAWTISLPDDWVQKQDTTNGTSYFESSDGSKAMYVTVWQIPGTSTAAQLAASIASISGKALQTMDGYSWRLVEQRTGDTLDVAIALVDHLADAKLYRIISTVMARPPLVVRASFHDYLCEDYGLSRGYFAPVIESLRLAGNRP